MRDSRFIYIGHEKHAKDLQDKLKSEPLYAEKLELGKLLMIAAIDMAPQQRLRIAELRIILRDSFDD